MITADAIVIHPFLTALKSRVKLLGVVQVDRTINGKATTALRFYITSKLMTAGQMLPATRAHWQVENNLHWMLDVCFNEDAC